MNRYLIFILGLLLLLVASSCSSVGEEAIRYGSDQCSYCKMNIVDKNFGAELVTKKGKIYKFDSIECLAAYEMTGDVKQENVHSLWVTDISSPGKLQNIESMAFYHSEKIKSPMGLGFYSANKATTDKSLEEKYGSSVVAWIQVKEIVKKAWL